MSNINFQSKIFLKPRANEFSIFDDFVQKAKKLGRTSIKSNSKQKESSMSISKQMKTEMNYETIESIQKTLQKPVQQMQNFVDQQIHSSPFKFQLPLRLEKTLHFTAEKRRIPACLTSRRLKSNLEGSIHKSLQLSQLKAQKNQKSETPNPEQQTKFLITKYFLSKPLVCIKSKQLKKQLPALTELE